MHAYIFVGGEPHIREKKMLDFAQKIGEKIYEFPIKKIADVRSLADFTKFSQETSISILIKNIDSATKEALNAFLKNLEEPGRNISYFLSCANEQALLPTIVSRCNIIRFGRTSKKEDSNIASSFLKMSFGQKIKALEYIKKKDEAKAYLQKLTLSSHKKMVQKDRNTYREATLIKIAQKAIYNLNLNANVNLQMTNFAIKTSKI